MKRKMRIAIIGYGKMGHMIEDVARSRGHEIVARIDVGDAFDLKDADVAIEFTTPATAKDNILRAWAQGVPVVCGTTGWIENLSPTLSSREGELGGRKGEWKIEESSNKVIVKDETGKVMLVWSSNYSVGVNIFFELNKFLAEQMKNLTPSCSTDGHRQSDRAELFTPSKGGEWEERAEEEDGRQQRNERKRKKRILQSRVYKETFGVEKVSEFLAGMKKK